MTSAISRRYLTTPSNAASARQLDGTYFFEAIHNLSMSYRFAQMVMKITLPRPVNRHQVQVSPALVRDLDNRLPNSRIGSFDGRLFGTAEAYLFFRVGHGRYCRDSIGALHQALVTQLDMEYPLVYTDESFDSAFRLPDSAVRRRSGSRRRR